MSDETLRKSPELAKQDDAAYGGANWVEAGVVEADCLVCHARSYDGPARAAALRAGRLCFAATLGAGLGTWISASAPTSTAPAALAAAPSAGPPAPMKLLYNRRVFDEDGRAHLEIERRPSDANCLQCNGRDGLRARGLTWEDSHNVYLSTAANPGTAQSVFAGWVTKGWARLHHPLWYENLTRRNAVDVDENTLVQDRFSESNGVAFRLRNQHDSCR